MKWNQGLLNARSHIAFSVGLCLAAGIALRMETGFATSLNGGGGNLIAQSVDQTPLANYGVLSAEDKDRANIAWAYFVKNTQEETGLVNAADNFPSSTIWDQASYLLGMISALRIGIIAEEEFNQRMDLALNSLASLELYNDQLPNKVYDTRNLKMTNYANKPVENGIGWSALDVARMSVPLNILVYDFPMHGPRAVQILNAWNFDAMISDGVMMGARTDPNTEQIELVQEGRLGYEEYGARAAALLGIDALQAVKYDDFLQFETVSGQQIAIDSRSFSEFDAHNYVVSEPYILSAIEFGLDYEGRELAHRIYRAQEERYLKDGILTAVSEDNIDQEPYFIYNTVFANGQAWNPLAEDGTSHPDKRTVSTKAVFGWDALYATDYTAELMDHVKITKSKNSGWRSGVYEKNGQVNDIATANTNGIILETISYKLNGPLVTSRFKGGSKHD